MKTYRRVSVYRKDTGAITGCIRVEKDEEPTHLVAEGKGWVDGNFSGDHYCVDLSTGKVVPVAQFEPIIEGNTISNLPEGTKVAVNRTKGAEVGPEGRVHIGAQFDDHVIVTLMHPDLPHPVHEFKMNLAGGASPSGDAVSLVPEQDYSLLRMRDYGDKGDQLDEIMRGLDAIINGQPIPQSVKDAVERWKGVKSRFPKPEGKQT